MGIDFSNTSMLSRLAAPIQSLAAWFVPTRSASRPLHAATRPEQMALPFASGTMAPGVAGAAASASALRCRLRVVREFDLAVSPSCAGRMVISGRMSDVCAELERMSQGKS